MMKKMNDLINYIADYIVYLKQTGYAENSIKTYEIHLRYFYSYINQFEIDYLNVKGSEMMNLRKHMSIYAPSTINGRLSAIKNFYQYLELLDVPALNPVRTSHFIRSNRTKPRPLSKANQNIFIDYISTKPDHIFLAFYLMLETGIRLAELLELRKEHFININQITYLEILNSKNNNSRLVPIFNQDLLERLEIFFDTVFEGTIFSLTNRAYQYYADEFNKLYDIEFNVHTCRHTFATNKAREGVPVVVIQKLLGHLNIQTTMYYIEINDSIILDLRGDKFGNYEKF